MSIFKNVSSQKLVIYAINSTTGNPVISDSTNITAYISKDGGTPVATDDINPTELDSTSCEGIYLFNLTQAETNADIIVVNATSTTEDVVIDPVIIYTEPYTVDANIVQISSDTSAAINLKNQFNGTGIVGDTYPATQVQAGNLTVSSAAINKTASSYTLTSGTQTANTYTSTAALDNTRHTHTDNAGVLDLYYQFNVGNDGIPVSTKITGTLTGINDTLGVYAYNWDSTTWDQIGSLIGSATTTNQTNSYDLLTSHVGVGSNIGLVRIRFYAASGLTTATLYVDQILVSYTQAVAGISNGSTVTLGSSTQYSNLIGRSWNLALGGQNISGSYIYQAKSVTGTATSTNGIQPVFQECAFGTASLSSDVFIHRCAIGGTLTLTSTAGVSTDTFFMFDSYSGVAGSGTPTIDATGTTKTTGINIRNWTGGMNLLMSSYCTASLEVHQGGTQTVTTNGGNLELRGVVKAANITSSGSSVTNIHGIIGSIIIAGTAGTVNIYGVHGTVTDNSNDLVTINDYGVDKDDIKDIHSMSKGDFIIDTTSRTIEYKDPDNTGVTRYTWNYSEDGKIRTVTTS